MNDIIETALIDVASVRTGSLMSVNYLEGIQDEGKAAQVKKKITQDRMLDSLFDSATGECHEHSSELMDMIKEEYQVGMMEVSSGNGQAYNDYNVATGEYEFLLSATATDGREHSSAGLSNMLVDSAEGLTDKNKAIIPAYQVTDDNGQTIRIDNHACMVTVDNSDYSIWDTIAENGALIVRHSGHWQGKNCTFGKEGYAKREKARMIKKHNKLMQMSSTFTGNDTVKKLAVKSLNKDKKGNKQLTKLATAARRGQQWAIDDLAKIGYNEY